MKNKSIIQGIAKIWDKDNYQLLGLLLISFYLVYFSPSIKLTRFAFLLLLIPMYLSKKDYLWLAWLFIILDAPGYLFKGGLLNEPNRIPVYPVIASVTISFFDLAILTLVVKSIYLRKRIKIFYIFKREMIFLIGIILFYLLYSVAAFSFDFGSFYRTITPWAFVFICFCLLDNEKKLINLNKLIFPIVFVALVLLVYYLFTGVHFVNIFKEGYGIKSNIESQITEESKFAARSLFSVFIILYCLVMAMVYLIRRPAVFPKLYLILIISSSFLTCFLTATRGYLIVVSFIIIASFIVKSTNIYQFIKTAFSLVVIIIIFYTVINSSPIIKKQYNLATERYQTVYLFLKGDITAGGTIGRINYRIPKVMIHVKEYPLFGYGFSELYYENADGDVGFFTVLLNLGYFGTVLVYFAFFSILFKTYKWSSNYKYLVYYKKSGFIFLIGFIGLHLYHLTTNIAFGLTPSAGGMYPERYLIYALFLTNFNLTVSKMILPEWKTCTL